MINQKETILTNEILIINTVNELLSNSKNFSNFAIDGIYTVAKGRGTKKDQLQLSICSKGEYTVNLIIDTITFKPVNGKPLGKYSKEASSDMVLDAYDIYYKFIKEVVSNLNNQTNEEVKENENMLTVNEKEVIATRLSVNTSDLNESIFTAEELKEAKIIALINHKAELLVNDTMIQRENIDITNKGITQLNMYEKDMYKYYIHNIKVNILDGTHNDTIESIREEYKTWKAKMEERVTIEKSWSLPDHEVTLSIFIKRDGRYEGIVKAEHEKAVKEALENGLHVPSEVMKDYSHLVKVDTNENETTYSVGNKHFNEYSQAVNYCNENDFDPTLMIIKEVASVQPSNAKQYKYKDMFYFNNYDIDTMTSKQWEHDIKKHNNMYYQLKDTEILTGEQIEQLAKNNYSFWLEIVNNNPYYHKQSYMIDLSLRYINRSITLYINKKELEKFIHEYHNKDSLRAVI